MKYNVRIIRTIFIANGNKWLYNKYIPKKKGGEFMESFLLIFMLLLLLLIVSVK